MQLGNSFCKVRLHRAVDCCSKISGLCQDPPLLSKINGNDLFVCSPSAGIGQQKGAVGIDLCEHLPVSRVVMYSLSLLGCFACMYKA